MFSNKTNPPPVGHYRPKQEAIEIGPRDQTFFMHHQTAEMAQKRKFSNDQNNKNYQNI